MIGVYGGTFDPVHFGHLRSALEIKEAVGIEQMKLIPCGQPPHRCQPLAPADMRCRMLELAIEGDSGLGVDSRELEREGPSYMVDTLASIGAEQPAQILVLIVGMDAFEGISRWHQWRELFSLAHIAVMQRPGYSAQLPAAIAALDSVAMVTECDQLTQRKSGCIYFHEVTQLEISATKIRELIRQGCNPRYLMPERVLQLIERERLYR